MTLRYGVLTCCLIKVTARALFSRCGPQIQLFLDVGEIYYADLNCEKLAFLYPV